MKKIILIIVILFWGITALAEDSFFSLQLNPKFQMKGCTNCHDFYDEGRSGLFFNSHRGRTSDQCVYCHTQDITGFKYASDWFARPGLYTSGMDSKETCEAIKTGLHAKFKNQELLARELERHLFDDPRILWAIEGATPNSGQLPNGEKEKNLVKEGLSKWKKQISGWIKEGMKCQ
jgi:hypothetical protein